MDGIIRKAGMNDFETLWNIYSQFMTDKIQRISKRIVLFDPVSEQKGLKKYITDGRFFVAEHGNRIVSQMAIDFPREIRYISLNNEQIEISGAFLHQDYTLEDFRDMGFSSRILEAIEAEAMRNQKIEHIYVAVEGMEPLEWWEERGYAKIGKECMSCPLWEIGCRNVPMYRKKRT